MPRSATTVTTSSEKARSPERPAAHGTDRARTGDRARPRPARTSRAADRDRSAERASRLVAERRRRADQSAFFDVPPAVLAAAEARGAPREEIDPVTRDGLPGFGCDDAGPRGFAPTAKFGPEPVRDEWVYAAEPPPERGRPGRPTVTITGLGSEGYATRRGTRSSTAQRHQSVKRHERDGFRPDRVAMWAVMLGVMLMLAAAASSHAAVLAHHVLAR